jgi:hypothetical protein
MYRIIVWHNSATEGTHQSVLLESRMMGKVLRDFDRYLNHAPARSFNENALIQLHHVDRGVIAHFPPSLRGSR